MDYDTLYDFRETHTDYLELISQYSETELYKEIIHCMNLLFPEWNSNYGIGCISSEFVLTTIQNLEYIEDFTDINRREQLKTIYQELTISYKDSKLYYQSIIKDAIDQKFKNTFTDVVDLEELCDLEYNNRYNGFVEKEMTKVFYKF